MRQEPARAAVGSPVRPSAAGTPRTAPAFTNGREGGRHGRHDARRGGDRTAADGGGGGGDPRARARERCGSASRAAASAPRTSCPGRGRSGCASRPSPAGSGTSPGGSSTRSGPASTGSALGDRVVTLSQHAYAEYDIAEAAVGGAAAGGARRAAVPGRAARLRDEHPRARRDRARADRGDRRHRLSRGAADPARDRRGGAGDRDRAAAVRARRWRGRWGRRRRSPWTTTGGSSRR